MSGRARAVGGRRRLRTPPIGFQHGRRERVFRTFPMVSWLYYWLTAHTTARLYLFGAVGVGPTALLLVAGYDSPSTFVGYAVLAWMAACMAAGYALRPRLQVEMHVPLRVESGSRFETRYTLRNTGRRTARELGIDTLIYSDWMSLRRSRAYLAALPPGAAETVTAEGHAVARGVYTLPSLRYDSGFPCGFWRWGRTDSAERTLSVYPRYVRLASLDLPLGHRHRQELSAARDLAREALEFHGCREYREGDALRHVHPRSSARLGVPVVKEFQAEGRSRTAILVDTRESGRLAASRARLTGDDPLEAALSLTAAMVEALSTTDRVLELLVAGPEMYRFVSSGRVGYFEEVLDILAAVEPCRGDPLLQLRPLLMEEIRDIQSVCLVLTGWDDTRAALVRELEAWEVGLKVVLVTARGLRPADVPPACRCLSARQVLRDGVLEL